MIVIDTLAAAIPGANENDSADISRVLARCKRVSDALKTHVMLVHHMNAQGSKVRGHSSIKANLENVILVEMDPERRDEDGRPLRHARLDKQKDGEDGARWSFVLRGGIETGKDKNGNPQTSCVVVPPEGRAAEIGGGREASLPDTAATLPTGKKSRCARSTRRPLTTARTRRQRSGLPAGIRVVEWAKWRARWARLAFDDEGRVQRKAERIGRALLTKRLIGKDGNWVWKVTRGKDAKAAEPAEPDFDWTAGQERAA